LISLGNVAKTQFLGIPVFNTDPPSRRGAACCGFEGRFRK